MRTTLLEDYSSFLGALLNLMALRRLNDGNTALSPLLFVTSPATGPTIKYRVLVTGRFCFVT